MDARCYQGQGSKALRLTVQHCEFPKILRPEPPSWAEAGSNLLEALCKHDSEATSESRESLRVGPADCKTYKLNGHLTYFDVKGV